MQRSKISISRNFVAVQNGKKTYRADLADHIGPVSSLVDSFVPVSSYGRADGVTSRDIEAGARLRPAAADLAYPLLVAAVGALFCRLSFVAGRCAAANLTGTIRFEAAVVAVYSKPSES